MNKSFTVIIPCFNVEKYISKCLDSLINQNYDINLLQILVIDDGSTNDELKKIVNQYQEKYKNIEYYSKENNHWGSVINYVLKNKLAKNDYVSILDADDFLDKNCFKFINKKVKDNDVFSGSCKEWNGTKSFGYFSAYYFPFKRVIKKPLQKQTPICLPMLFFYKKEIFYKTKYLTEKIAHQDGDYTAQILKNSNTLIFTYKVIGYYFSLREGNSMNQSWDQKRFDAEYNSCKKFIENDVQELIAFRLNVKGFKTCCKERNIIFEVNRKFNFKWLPFGLNFIYKIYFYITGNYKFFKINNMKRDKNE